VLGVLARTETELTMRTVAHLANVSATRAATVLNQLMRLGMVTRREAGSAALVSLVRDNEAAQAVLFLAGLRESALEHIGALAHEIHPTPTSLVVFGSFALGRAEQESDIDVLVVRPAEMAADDDAWTDSLGTWQDAARRVVGNPLNLIEVGAEEMASLQSRPGSVWQDVARDGILLVGMPVAELSSVP